MVSKKGHFLSKKRSLGMKKAALEKKIIAEKLQADYNPNSNAPVAQLDRVSGFEPGGREFESLRARQNSQSNSMTYNLFDFPM